MPVPAQFGVYAAGHGSATTWSATDKAANIALSGGNLVATAASSAAGSIRSTTSKASGKWHFEVTITVKASVNFPNIGLANAIAALTGGMGVDNNSIEYQPSGGVFTNNVQVATPGSFTQGDIIAVEIDVPGQLVFFQKLGNSRSAGTSVSNISGALFAAGSLNIATDALTVNFGASAFSIAPTAGFSAWG